MIKSFNCQLMIAMLGFILILIVAAVFSDCFNISSKDGLNGAEYIYYFSSIYLSVVLVTIAWINLKSIKDEIKSKFLYQIDERWGQQQILEGRKILHELIQKETNGSDIKSYYEEISNKLLEIYKNEPDKYIMILNLLEFMETMGYLVYEEKAIELEQVKKLCDYDITRLYEISNKLIDKLRIDYKNNNMFCNFQKMYYDILR